MGRRDCRDRLRVCTADVPAASPWGAGQGHGPFCICPTSPCCGSDRGKDAGERRGSRGCQQANAAEPGWGTARSRRPRQNVGEAAPQSLCLGVSSASFPPQPDGLGPGAGVFSHEEVFLRGCHGLMLVVMTTGGGCCVQSGTGGREGKGMAVEKGLARKGSGRGMGLACRVQGWRTPPGMQPSGGAGLCTFSHGS